MSILVVGSVAYDDIITPYDRRERALGGAATYFALAAQHFSRVNLVAVVGEDFDTAYEQLLADRNIDLRGLEKVAGKCFYWKGEYLANWNDRVTHDTQLNVFEHFNPKIPDVYQNPDFLFLGNIHPELQLQVLQAMERRPKHVVLDTMNLWINISRDKLLETLSHVDILIINDSEAMMLSGNQHLVDAANTIAKMGPKIICVKRGEYGALLFAENRIFAAPAYPLCKVVDPTGAGDTFAGGFVGYLSINRDFSFANLKKAAIYGSVMGSFTVESFSVDRCASLDQEDINTRYRYFVELTHFDHL